MELPLPPEGVLDLDAEDSAGEAVGGRGSSASVAHRSTAPSGTGKGNGDRSTASSGTGKGDRSMSASEREAFRREVSRSPPPHFREQGYRQFGRQYSDPITQRYYQEFLASAGHAQGAFQPYFQ